MRSCATDEKFNPTINTLAATKPIPAPARRDLVKAMDGFISIVAGDKYIGKIRTVASVCSIFKVLHSGVRVLLQSSGVFFYSVHSCVKALLACINLCLKFLDHVSSVRI